MSRLPVTILTGFLGSGKTTLLRHALAQEEMADTAVLVNEVGEIGLDHLLVDHVDEDTVLLASGCLCCAVRADLTGALRRLLLRRQAGDAPPFARVVVETSGLADPAPILSTIATTGFIRDRCSLGAVVTTVDAVYGSDALSRHPEAARQVAFADRVVVTKTDLVGDTGKLRSALAGRNPGAALLEAAHGKVDPALLFAPAETPRVPETIPAAHSDALASFDLRWSATLSWGGLIAALERLLAAYGDRIPRIKGLARVAEQSRPMVIHAVHHTLFPPTSLDRPAEAGSFLTFVTERLRRDEVEPFFREVIA
jgi:G3E family GTPase